MKSKASALLFFIIGFNDTILNNKKVISVEALLAYKEVLFGIIKILIDTRLYIFI
ncbi:hypothetical protein GCM10022423_30020 [Flavobacterium ginsengiterrae]|uniref:Uncharacterized protein n=1 Tax=Flavobacterium ginsengiterrae TaxID=871695 RepID=A0ABP7GVI8_9FLAO